MTTSLGSFLCCVLLVVAKTVMVSAHADNPKLYTWMTDSPYAYNATVYDMVFPGTHNSGACSRTQIDFLKPVSDFTKQNWWVRFASSNFSDPTGLPWNSGIDAGNLRTGIVNFTVTQPVSPNQQMMDGARFLEIKVARSTDPSDTTYYMVNTYAVAPLSFLLDGIGTFLQRFKGEVVMLLIMPTYNITSDIDLMSFIENYQISQAGKTVKDLMFPKSTASSVPGTFAQCGTIGDLVRSGKTLLPVYKFKTPPSQKPQTKWFYWSEAFFQENYAAYSSPPERQAFVMKELNRLWQSDKQGKVFKMVYTITPPNEAAWKTKNASDFVQAISNNYTSNAYRLLGRTMMNTLKNFALNTLSEQQQDFINIIAMDYIHGPRETLNEVAEELLKRRMQRRAAVTPTPSSASISQMPLVLAIISFFTFLFAHTLY